MSSNTPDGVPEEVPKSPKHLSFVIDFGNSKTVDTQRHKALVEKFKNRHKRGQSLSKLEDLPASAPSTTKHVGSGVTLPRKSGLQSESCDERGDHNKHNVAVQKTIQHSRFRTNLRLPLKNVNSDKMTQSYPNGSVTFSSELELQDISSPELDLPFSPSNVNASNVVEDDKLLQPLHNPESQIWKVTNELSDLNGEKFVEGTDFDFNNSDTPSETGTYTLDTDNYTEEQKARMSIDREFNIEQISSKQKTEEYVMSLQKKVIISRPKQHAEEHKNNSNEALASPILAQGISNDINEQKMKVVAPILSPTQNLSITDDMNCNKNAKIQKYDDKHHKSDSDQGCVTSITASGAFGRKNNIKNETHFRKSSLTKSEIETQMYIHYGNKINNKSAQSLESQQLLESKSENKGALHFLDCGLNKLVTLPPSAGGTSGKSSPTKIPSPVHYSRRPRSCNSTVDSDSSIETETFLKPTQNYINSLQKRLSLDSNHDTENDKKCNLRLNNEIHKMSHIRHNSFDDKNLQDSNKLEHFQNKSLQGIDQTYINKFNQFSNTVHKIHNSPNNSPIQRSSSFSTNTNQISNSHQKTVNTTVCLMPKQNNLRNSPILSPNNLTSLQATINIKQRFLQLGSRSSIASERSRGNSRFGEDTESSSEEDFERDPLRKKDLLNVTTTRYNRAFTLRRARLDEQPQPKCPNTPEIRRKFQTANHLQPERAVSVDRRPLKSNATPSRYLQSITRPKTAEKYEAPKHVPKHQSEKVRPLSRTDSGRFSMRLNKPGGSSIQKKDSGGKKQTGGRSNSSLSSREVDFQNWKRRKSYDPMKAAAEGKKTDRAKKQCQNSMTQSYNENNQSQDCDSSPSHSSSVHRSQSFHGTAALAQLISSEEEDDLTLSADEGFSPPAPSPYKLSPARMISRQAWRDKLLN